MRTLLFGIGLVILLAVCQSASRAQTGSIVGTVRDAATHQPLAAVQVGLLASSSHAVTASDGRYRIDSVPAGTYRIQSRLIGYRALTRNVTVASGEVATVDFDVVQQVVMLDAVVATGVGITQEVRRLGSSTATLSGASIREKPVQNVTEALTGHVAGVLPVPRGEAGAAAPIRLRGQHSMTQRNDPIVYVDGVRVDASAGVLPGISTSRLNDLNPQDIDRIEVIKGASAATMFGTEASSGVILIFTKRGKEGAPQYTLAIDQEMSRIPLARLPAVQAYDEANNRLVSEYPADAIFHSGYRQAYNLSVSGGTPTVRYFASGRYMDDEGATRATGVKNVSLRTSIDMNVGSKLQASLGINVIRNDIKSPGGTFGYIGVHMLANPLAADSVRPYGESFASVEGAANDKHLERADTRTIDAKATYSWTPNLVSKLTIGNNQVFQETSSILERGAGKIVLLTGRRVVDNYHRTKTTVDFNTSWNHQLNDAVSSSLLLGGQSFFETNRGVLTAATDFPAAGLRTLSGGATISEFGETFEEVVNAGVFGQWQLGIEDRLFLTAGLRADGNSAFGKDFGMQAYPKFGLSYVISEAPFWPGKKIGWDVLRLRAAYGTSGLQPGAFDAVRTYRPRTRLDGQPIVWAGNVGNPDLRPERSVELEFGADMSFFDDRAGLELTYFSQKTVGAIMPRPLPASQGFLEPELINVGEMKSHGLEALLRFAPIRRPNIGLTLSASIATLHEKVTDLGEGVTSFRLDGQGNRSQGYIAVGYMPGAQIGSVLDESDPYSLTVPVDQLTSLSQIVPHRLKNSAGGDSTVFLGNPLPSFTGSFSSDLILFGKIKLRSLFVAATGFTLYNESSNIWYQSGTMPDVSQMEYELAQPSTSTERRQEIAEEYARKHPSIFGNWVFDGDYLRFQELALSYDMPTSAANLFHASTMSLSLTASNLALWTRCDGCIADPGAAGDRPLNNGQRVLIATERFNAPSPRRLTLSVRAVW